MPRQNVLAKTAREAGRGWNTGWIPKPHDKGTLADEWSVSDFRSRGWLRGRVTAGVHTRLFSFLPGIKYPCWPKVCS